jgi:hypothetical protein
MWLYSHRRGQGRLVSALVLSISTLLYEAKTKRNGFTVVGVGQGRIISFWLSPSQRRCAKQGENKETKEMQIGSDIFGGIGRLFFCAAAAIPIGYACGAPPSSRSVVGRSILRVGTHWSVRGVWQDIRRTLGGVGTRFTICRSLFFRLDVVVTSALSNFGEVFRIAESV